MEFSSQEYWSELSFPSPGNLPDPGIEPRFSALQADSLPSESLGKLFIEQLSYARPCPESRGYNNEQSKQSAYQKDPRGKPWVTKLS